MMTPAMREDLAGRKQDIQRGKTVELLRRAGKEMYDNPIVNTAIGFTPGVGDVQAAGETFAALQRGAPWQETAGYAVGMLPFVPALRTTWHGSPHGFTKFDMSKIGTGEGAQAYGHGLYLAESPDVAGSYRTAGDMGWFEREADKALYSQDIDNAIASTKKELERVSKEPRYVDAKNNLTGVLNVLEARKAGANEYGHLYKVDLPDEQIAKMLDWDKPLSQQAPEVQKVLSGMIEQRRVEYPNLGKDPTGNIIYQMIGGNVGATAQKEASQALHAAGIPGIQYLDQASRGAGEGTRNYVVFSDEIPQILERNGQPIAQALRNYEAPKQAFDVTKQDVSDIFGEGASRIRYQDPNTQGFIDVLQKPDGTASVLGLEVPEAARGKGIGQSLQQQVLSDFPEMQGRVSSKAAATTAHRIGRRPVGNPEATLDDVFRMIDEDSSVNLVSPEMQKRFNFGG